MVTQAQALRDANKILAEAGVTSAQNDASLLLAFALGIARTQLDPFAELSDEAKQEFENLISKRAKRIPLQHLTGQAYFRHITLRVGAGVFIPRPETELLAQAGIDYLNSIPSPRLAVDLCAGSGAVALSMAIEAPNTTVHAIEFSQEAFTWLQQNVEDHSSQLSAVGSKVICYLADATDQTVLAQLEGQVDVVLSNPPYIPEAMIPREPEARDYDPEMALFSGPDGLDVARGVVLVASLLLKQDGLFGMEHADVQGEEVPAILNQKGSWGSIRDNMDYNGLPRYATAFKAVRG